MNTLTLIVAAVLTVAAGIGRAEDPPPIFAKLAFDDAVAKSKDSGKILVVKATAEWCGPCKMMDKTTWRDETVVTWFEANGLAIQIDVDRQPDLARQLKIQAMPTMVAFVKGVEFDRVVGYKDADSLLAWADGVKRGEKSTAALLRKADRAKAGDGAPMTMQERLSLAQSLAQSGEDEKAAEEYVWLWNNMAKEEPAMVGVRGSFMVTYMKQLAASSDSARGRFAAMRDETETRLKGENKTWEDLGDWIALNEVVAQEDKTLEWFDRIKGDPGAEATIDRHMFRIDRLLMEHGRWADWGRLIRNPAAKLRQAKAQMDMMLQMNPGGDDDRKAEMDRFARSKFRDDAAKLHAALLAAEREDDAKKIADEAIKTDDSGAMRAALVQWALKADQARMYHVEMLQDAEKKDDIVFTKPLRTQLAAKLFNRK